jgi:hypothetical protein
MQDATSANPEQVGAPIQLVRRSKVLVKAGSSKVSDGGVSSVPLQHEMEIGWRVFGAQIPSQAVAVPHRRFPVSIGGNDVEAGMVS